MAGGKGLLAGNIVQWDGEGLHWGRDFPRTDGSSFTVLAWHIVMRGRSEANIMEEEEGLFKAKRHGLPSPLDCQ